MWKAGLLNRKKNYIEIPHEQVQEKYLKNLKKCVDRHVLMW